LEKANRSQGLLFEAILAPALAFRNWQPFLPDTGGLSRVRTRPRHSQHLPISAMAVRIVPPHSWWWPGFRIHAWSESSVPSQTAPQRQSKSSRGLTNAGQLGKGLRTRPPAMKRR